jgi:G3E family GTPase
VKATVKSINGYAELIECRNSKVPLNKILGVNSFSIEKTLEVDPEFLVDDEAPGASKKKKHDLSGVGSVGLTMEGDIDDVVFNSFMQQLLQVRPSHASHAPAAVTVLAKHGTLMGAFARIHANAAEERCDWDDGVLLCGAFTRKNIG